MLLPNAGLHSYAGYAPRKNLKKKIQDNEPSLIVNQQQQSLKILNMFTINNSWKKNKYFDQLSGSTHKLVKIHNIFNTFQQSTLNFSFNVKITFV